MTSAWLILLLFFFVSFIIYHLLSFKFRWIFLLIISLLFLFIVSGFFGFLYTLMAVFISYIGAFYIDKSNEEKIKIKILSLTIILLFLGLFILRFTNIFYHLVNFISQTFNINKNMVNNIIVPVGISYYTLILVAYVVDVYRKVTIVEKKFLKYLLFSIYFPQLLMGPIVRHNDTKEQLFSQKQVQFSYIKFGIVRILWGILKKIVIADRIAIVVNMIFDNYSVYSNTFLVLGLILFGLQFYVDFSAAMDIVLGISQCFGIKLPENFYNPFFSISFHQFWQRWHITIFTFYRDYIFYPIIRSKIITKLKFYLDMKSKWLKNHIPFFIAYVVVWLFAGFWHGGDLKAMFGNCMLPCIYLIFTDIIHDPLSKIYKKYKFIQHNLFYRFIQMIGVYILFCFCLLFFIANNIKEGFDIILKIFSHNNAKIYIDNIFIKDFYIIPLGLFVLFLVDVLKEKKINLEQIYVKKIPIILHWCIVILFILIICLFGLQGNNYIPKNFIYFSF